jgi:thymidine phosphorylase
MTVNLFREVLYLDVNTGKTAFVITMMKVERFAKMYSISLIAKKTKFVFCFTDSAFL